MLSQCAVKRAKGGMTWTHILHIVGVQEKDALILVPYEVEGA